MYVLTHFFYVIFLVISVISTLLPKFLTRLFPVIFFVLAPVIPKFLCPYFQIILCHLPPVIPPYSPPLIPSHLQTCSKFYPQFFPVYSLSCPCHIFSQSIPLSKKMSETITLRFSIFPKFHNNDKKLEKNYLKNYDILWLAALVRFAREVLYGGSTGILGQRHTFL